MTTTELHVIVCCSCVACEICIFGCVRSLVTLARERAWRVKREREIVVVTLATRAWRVTGKLGDFGRERETVA